MYNDFQIADTLSMKAMRQKFDEVQGLETQDLNEIYNKLVEQKNNLIENNSQGQLNNAITKIDESIKAIGEIINKNSQYEISKISQKSDRKNSAYKAFSLQSVLKQVLNPISSPDGAYGKIRSEQEMAMHSSSSTPDTTESPYLSSPISPITNEPNETPQDESLIGETQPNDSTNDNNASMPRQNGVNTSPLPNMNNAISPPTNRNETTRKRNSPMQGSFISRLTKSLFVNKQKNDIYNIPLKYRNRFHNIAIQSEECSPKHRLVSNQIDLIRLLLLFIALRPNCRYLSKVAKIANTQLEILMELVP
ncbi:MAG: hypothetical protein ACI4PF_05210 [Christensenellales bacterium]